jgi:hypothetical protein
LDDAFVSEDNFRIKNSKFPIKLQKGILNKSNVSKFSTFSKLSSNVFLQYKINKSDTTTKISLIEQF